ncbi:MAG: FAD-binding oxidoreductase [Shimia sp.]
MTLLDTLRTELGPAYVLTGSDAAPWSRDWTGAYAWTPLAVLRPGTTKEVAACIRHCAATRTAIVPASGMTGLTGATQAEGQVILSIDRLTGIRDFSPEGRTITVGAGTIVQHVQEAAEDHDLIFPLFFGARGSALVGGVLSTNAGGANVLRYGSVRELCLGLEVVLPNGEIADMLTPLRKNNTGYDLRNLMIGAEGTLGIITAATLKLFPKPATQSTALLALDTLDVALPLLNALQAATGGGVEAFELMPDTYHRRHARMKGSRPPFDPLPKWTILLEVASARESDARDGALADMVEATLAKALEGGALTDVLICQNEAQRQNLWAVRDDAAEITFDGRLFVDNDISVPIDRIPTFIEGAERRILSLDPDAEIFLIAHLGDGNLHYTVYPTKGEAIKDPMKEAIEEEVQRLGGAFSAEHGVGTAKLMSMTRRKDPATLAAMRAIKAALDPNNIMNPGKVVPPG